jgi:hypothetical protein
MGKTGSAFFRLPGFLPADGAKIGYSARRSGVAGLAWIDRII